MLAPYTSPVAENPHVPISTAVVLGHPLSNAINDRLQSQREMQPEEIFCDGHPPVYGSGICFIGDGVDMSMSPKIGSPSISRKPQANERRALVSAVKQMHPVQ